MYKYSVELFKKKIQPLEFSHLLYQYYFGNIFLYTSILQEQRPALFLRMEWYLSVLQILLQVKQ